ncbi:MAG: DUF1858 domain-containing protein [Lachnospiraceae bacterium]|nr:DUF1858 domain-containing protein [Lachnospiraceae bacterium]
MEAYVNKKTYISELLQIDPNVVPALLQIGMGCYMCPASLGETIEQAAYVHGIDPDDLVDDLNMVIADDLKRKAEEEAAQSQA